MYPNPKKRNAMDIRHLIDFPVSEITVTDADVERVRDALPRVTEADFAAQELDARYLGFGDETKTTLILGRLESEGLLKRSYVGSRDRRWRIT
jgi:hypothetical protein